MQVSHESIDRTLDDQSRGAVPKELTRYLRTPAGCGRGPCGAQGAWRDLA